MGMYNIDYVSVYDSLYIGIRNGKALKSGDDQLGFVTYFDKDNAAFRKRQDTIVSWAGSKGYHDYLDNEPQIGFKIVDYATRYSTSNKLFEVVDPRGFKLQITAENIVWLIQNSIIVNGTVKEACVWARHSGNNFLLPVTSNLYEKGIQEDISIKDLVPFDKISTASYTDIVYQGFKYVVGIVPEGKSVKHKYQGQSWYTDEYQTDYKYKKVNLGKQHIFTFDSDDDSHLGTKKEEINKNYAHITRIDLPKSPKIVAFKSVKIKSKRGNIKNTYKQPEDDRYFKLDNAPKSLNYSSEARVMFFDTKEEAEKFDSQAMAIWMNNRFDKVIESQIERNEYEHGNNPKQLKEQPAVYSTSYY